MLQSKRKNTCIFAVLAVVLALGLALPLAGCGERGSNESDSKKPKGTPVASEVIWLTNSSRPLMKCPGMNLIINTTDDRKAQIFDYEGKLIAESDYWSIEFSEGLALVVKEEKGGFIDAKGKVVVPLEYDGANSFSEGLAAVEKDGTWGFIDAKGRVVILLEYDNVRPFSEEGFAQVEKDGKYGLVDTKGHVVIPPEYDRLYFSYDQGENQIHFELVFVQKGASWGFCVISYQ